MTDFADRLLAELDAAHCWPLPREEAARRAVADRRALRRGDKPRLKAMANWDRWLTPGQPERDYLIDPLAKLISKSFADFLYGEDPRYIANPDSAGDTANPGQDDLDHAVEENRFSAGLHRGERLCSSEGEVFFKLHVNREVADVALVDWLSRLNAIPYLYGGRLLAVAFITEVGRSTMPGPGKDDDETEIVWRAAEIHTAGRVLNVLYRGGCSELGPRVPLTDHSATAHLAGDQGEEATADGAEWAHGLAMLAGRIVNDVDEDESLGESDYDQVRDLLLALNEAVTIAAENARLTGQDRVFAAGKLMPDGSFDASLNVYRVETEGGTLGEGDGKPPVVAMEKHYDAEPLWLHIAKLTALIITRVGLVAQWLGEGTDGQRAESGTAIRLRFLPTVNTATAKARHWDPVVPQILHLILLIGALSEQDGGFGRTYASDEAPAVERSEPLPADETEVVNRNAVAVAAEIRSRFTAIAEQHPDWGETEILAELVRIRQDTALAPADDGPDVPTEQDIRDEHPDWTDDQVQAELERLSHLHAPVA